MEISGNMGPAAQEMSINKAQAGYDVLTKTLQKAVQPQQNDQQRMEIAEQTGKGQNIDIKA